MSLYSSQPLSNVNTTGPPSTPPSRDELRRRIDDELARLGDIEVSSWMMGLPPSAQPTDAPGDDRPQASEVELDVELGHLLWRTGPRLEQPHCFHAIGPDGALVAVLRPETGIVFVRRFVASEDLPGLRLHRRPAGAANAPLGYRMTSIAALLWRFALFGANGDQALPDAYRQLPLHLRRTPPLPHELVAGRHFKLMHLLKEQNRSFAELQVLTNLSDAQLSRDLGALLLVGSLATA